MCLILYSVRFTIFVAALGHEQFACCVVLFCARFTVVFTVWNMRSLTSAVWCAVYLFVAVFGTCVVYQCFAFLRGYILPAATY